MEKISEKNQNKILQHLKWLLAESRLLAGALTAQFETFDYQAHIEIIASVLITDGKIPLSKKSARDLVQNIVWSFKKDKNNTPSWEELHNKILSSINDYNQRPTKEYLILFPLFIRKSSSLRNIRVLSTTFRVSSWIRIKKFSGWKKFVRQFESIETGQRGELEQTLLTRFIPLLVKVKAQSYIDAFEKSNRDFEILRSTINLVIEYGIFHGIFIGSEPKNPLGKCLPPKVYGIFEQNEGFKQIAYTKKEYNYISIEGTNTEAIAYASKWFLLIRKLKTELQEIIASALIRYGEAMDTTDWSVSFLALWQVLELLSLRNIARKNLTMSDVSNRIGNLMKDQPYFAEILDTITHSRNSLVHEGEFSEEGYRGMNFIKVVAENAIGSFIDLSSKFSSISEMDLYYDMATKNDHDLHKQQNAINKLLKFRNKK